MGSFLAPRCFGVFEGLSDGASIALATPVERPGTTAGTEPHRRHYSGDTETFGAQGGRGQSSFQQWSFPMSVKFLIISAAAAMTASTAANSAQLIRNGGFEDGNFTGWVNQSTLPDHVVTGPLTPFSGTYYADVGGGSGTTKPFAALAQAITLAAPGMDTLTYDLNFSGTTASDVFFARWDNKLVKGSLVKGAAGSGNGWVTYTFTVDALGGGKDRLAFDFKTPNGDSPWALDQVSLTGPGIVGSATPEPAAWALMLTGMGGLGFAIRRRRYRAPALI